MKNIVRVLIFIMIAIMLFSAFSFGSLAEETPEETETETESVPSGTEEEAGGTWKYLVFSAVAVFLAVFAVDMTVKTVKKKKGGKTFEK